MKLEQPTSSDILDSACRRASEINSTRSKTMSVSSFSSVDLVALSEEESKPSLVLIIEDDRELAEEMRLTCRRMVTRSRLRRH